VSENRVLRRILGHRRKKVKEARDNYIMASFIIFTPREIPLELTNQGEMGRACSIHENKAKFIQNCDRKPEGKRPL
jgi:hypothetical protein